MTKEDSGTKTEKQHKAQYRTLQDSIKATENMMKATMASAFDPIKIYEDSIKAKEDWMKSTRASAFDHLNTCLDSIKATDRLMHSFLAPAVDPMKMYGDSIKATDRLIKATMAPAFDPLSTCLDSIKATDRLMHSFLAPAVDPMKDIREAYSTTYYDSLISYQKSMNPLKFGKQLKPVLDALSERGWSKFFGNVGHDVTFNSDGTVLFASDTVTQVELQSISDQVMEEVFGRVEDQLESVFQRLASVIRTAQDPVRSVILKYVIFPIIVGLIVTILGPIANSYINPKLAEKRQVTKLISKHTIASVDNISSLSAYRFVSRRFLNVRAKPCRNSQLFGNLYLGQIVELVYTNKDWSLVIWRDDENNLLMQGWVFSRYLERFKVH